MRQSYTVWEYPNKEHKVKADIQNIREALHVFCTITGVHARDLECDTDTWDNEYAEFHHKGNGFVGGIKRSSIYR